MARDGTRCGKLRVSTLNSSSDPLTRWWGFPGTYLPYCQPRRLETYSPEKQSLAKRASPPSFPASCGATSYITRNSDSDIDSIDRDRDTALFRIDYL